MAVLEPLDIVNAACALIGDYPLQDLSTDTVEGQPASLLYQVTVDFNLGVYNFSFARQLFPLSVDDAANSLVGYSKVFDLPPERLDAPIYITDDPSRPERRFSDYRIVGSKVHTNAASLAAECKFRAHPSRWSAAFKQATITALGAALALSRAHDKDLRDRLNRDAYGPPSELFKGGQMRAAISTDSFGNPPRKQAVFQNPLEAARYS